MGVNSFARRYDEFLEGLDTFATSGGNPKNFGLKTDRAWLIATDHSEFQPDLGGHTDYAGTVSNDLIGLARLRDRRTLRKVHEIDMPMTSEQDALDELQAVNVLLSDLVFPTRLDVVSPRPRFVNTLLNDVYNLSLAYTHSIVQSAADEYVPEGDVYKAKVGSTELARYAFVFANGSESLDRDRVAADFSRFSNALRGEANPNWLRDFKLTFVRQKHVHRKEDCIDALADSVPQDFTPDFLVPIAQGGIELGVRLDANYRKRGHEPVNYPVMFSIKTRRQRVPWTHCDTQFMGMLSGKNVLVTEDWVTTGMTLKGVLSDLDQALPRDMRTAAYKRDPKSLGDPQLQNHQIYAGMLSHYAGSKGDGNGVEFDNRVDSQR